MNECQGQDRNNNGPTRSFQGQLDEALVEQVLQHAQRSVDLAQRAYQLGESDNEPDAFDSLVNTIEDVFNEEKRGFIEARNGIYGESLDSFVLEVCYSQIAGALMLAFPELKAYLAEKVKEARSVVLLPAPKDSIDLMVEAAFSDRAKMKKLAIKLLREEVKANGNTGSNERSPALRYVLRRLDINA
jgi:hypothetical protein